MLKRQKGQGIVEFALIMPVLMLTILAIIETALIFQGYLTVQHAAREAARWAVTYNPERGKDVNGDVCCPEEMEDEQLYLDRRVRMIKQLAVEKAVGLRIDRARLGLAGGPDLGGTFDAYKDEPNFFGVEVWGLPSFVAPPGGWTDADLRDHPGLPGLPVRVKVTHNVELLDPLYRAMVPRVQVVAQTEMINEGTQAGYGNVAPPALATPPSGTTPRPGPPITDTPTPEGGGDGEPTPEGTPTNTSTASPTPTTTPTNTPTPTPSGPFITVSDYQVIPAQVILIDVNQHAPGTYELHWVGGGGVTVISSTLQVDASRFKRNIVFTIPDNSQGIYYIETQGIDSARSAPIEVVPPPPDLVVRSIGVPAKIAPNREITLTVEVENLTASSVTEYFDVDVYVDPPYEPTSNRPGTSKQWVLGIGPRQTKVITHVVTLYGGGVHELWAQVDTSNWVPDELYETNNVFGPLGVTAVLSECSELSDRFDGPELDPKWSSAMIGDAGVHEMTIDEEEGTLSITANGTNLWDRPDRGSTLLYQEFTGDFVATLRIIQPLEGSGEQWAKIGLMARASTAANSRWVMVVKSRDAVQFGFRDGAGGQRFANDVTEGTPIWVRLVRSGDSFVAYYSGNGKNWLAGMGNDENGGVEVSMPGTILIGIAAASHSGTPGTGTVDDFEVCSLDADGGTCQVYSDDFDDEVLTDWTDVDIGNPAAPGSSSESGGTITVDGDGTSIWEDSDSFHYTYKRVGDNFVATLRINSVPGTHEDAKGGLMVRDSASPGSAHVMLMNLHGSGLQFARRENGGDETERIRDDYPGSKPWVRIVRNGSAFSAFYSNDGENWTYYGSTTANLADEVMIGMAVSSYGSGVIGSGNFDDFIFCAGAAGAGEPPLRPPEDKPPGLKECVQTIELGSFEASVISPPWVRNVDAFHTYSAKHSGNFSLGFRASLGPRPEYKHLTPWAYQTVSVPDDVLPATTGALSLWQFVAPDPSGDVRDPDDHFYLAIRNSSGVTLTADISLAQGDTDTPVFQQKVVNVETYLTGNRLADLAGQDIQLMFYGVHDGQPPGTYFYMDDVRLDICTTQPIPDDVPGTASMGGLLEVWLAGVPTKMPGVSVWAYAPGGAMYATKTIHDSTYHFYNIPPGTFTIYAEVWVGGYLYTGTTEVTVVADERNYAVDMLLQ